MAREADRIRIRPATRADIPAIVRAHVTSVDEADLAGFATPRETQAFADAARLSAAWTDPDRVGTEEVLVAELGGRVVAYAIVEDRGRETEIDNVAVAREAQGRGIGAHLVCFIEEQAESQGKEAVTLGTSRNAEGVPWRSLPWWESLGYRVAGEEENAWTRRIGPGTREIRMRKDVRAR